MKKEPFKAQVIYRSRVPALPALPSEGAIGPRQQVAPLGPDGFAQRLRYVRKVAGISQREVDRYAALTMNYTSGIECGRKDKALEARIVARLARVFGCTMDWLFLGIGMPPSAGDIETALDIADSKLRDVNEAVLMAQEQLRKI